MHDPILYGPARDQGPLPLVVGVTGHRDLAGRQPERLEACLRRLLPRLQKYFPHTPLVLLTALDGEADRLAARVACELGARLVVALAQPADLCEKGLPNENARADFAALLRKAERVLVISDAGGVGPRARAGAFLARSSQALVALWDGEPSDEEGGPAQVVRFWREGGPLWPGQAPPGLEPGGPRPFCHVLARVGPDKLRWSWQGLGRPARLLGLMDGFNADVVRRALVVACHTGKEDLLSDEVLAGLPLGLHTTIAALREWYAAANALALHFQARQRAAMWLLFVLMLIAGAFLRAFFSLPGETWARAGAAAGGGVASALATLIWLLHYGPRHISARALAEGLRVQTVWRLAGLRDATPDHYLRPHRADLEWVPLALRNSTLLAEREDPEPAGAPPSPPPGLALVLDFWVRAQKRFFDDRAPRLEGQRWKLTWGGRAAGCVGVAWLLVRFLGGTVSWLPNPGDRLGEVFGLGAGTTYLLAFLDVVFGLGLVLAGLLYRFGKAWALDRQAKLYRDQASRFEAAEKALTAVPPADVPNIQGLLLDLGKTALVENGEWARLQRVRQEEAPAE